MRKEEFFSKLRFYLSKAYTQDEVEEIIRDYEEYFTDGIHEGETEEKIIKSLGDPEDIVEDMVQTDIEDGKYTREDFNTYYSFKNDGNEDEYKNNINVDSYKFKTNSRFKTLESFVIICVLIIADICYFGTVLLTGIGIEVGLISSMILFPTGLNLLSVLEINKLMLIFPVMLVIGSFVFVFIITYLLVKLGIGLNKNVIGYINGTKKTTKYINDKITKDEV